MAGDVSVLLDLDAKQLYNELQQVQNHIVSFAKHSEEHGGKAGHGFVSSLKNAFSGIGDVLGNVKNAITSTAGLLGIGVGVGAGVAEIKSVIEFGAHIEDLSRKTGVNAETLSRWGFAAQKTGTDIDGLSKFIGFLEINREKAARGDEAKIQSFKNLGVTAEQIKNPLLSVNDILLNLSKGNLTALDLKAVGGKGALEMRQFLQEVGDGTLKLDKSLSALDTKKLKEVQDAFIDLKNSITVGLAPAIVQVFRSLEDHADVFVTHLKEAAVQLTALHDAAKTKTPGAFFEALGKGQDETKKLEQDLFNRHTEREKKRIEEEAAPAKTDKHSLLSDEADEIAQGKADKKEAKAAAKEEAVEKRGDREHSLDVIGADTASKLDRAKEKKGAAADDHLTGQERLDRQLGEAHRKATSEPIQGGRKAGIGEDQEKVNEIERSRIAAENTPVSTDLAGNKRNHEEFRKEQAEKAALDKRDRDQDYQAGISANQLDRTQAKADLAQRNKDHAADLKRAHADLDQRNNTTTLKNHETWEKLLTDIRDNTKNAGANK